MTNDLGVWKADDCALVFIDFQNEMFEVIRSETNADLVELPEGNRSANIASANSTRRCAVNNQNTLPGSTR